MEAELAASPPEKVADEEPAEIGVDAAEQAAEIERIFEEKRKRLETVRVRLKGRFLWVCSSSVTYLKLCSLESSFSAMNAVWHSTWSTCLEVLCRFGSIRRSCVHSSSSCWVKCLLLSWLQLETEVAELRQSLAEKEAEINTLKEDLGLTRVAILKKSVEQSTP